MKRRGIEFWGQVLTSASYLAWLKKTFARLEMGIGALEQRASRRQSARELGGTGDLGGEGVGKGNNPFLVCY